MDRFRGYQAISGIILDLLASYSANVGFFILPIALGTNVYYDA